MLRMGLSVVFGAAVLGVSIGATSALLSGEAFARQVDQQPIAGVYSIGILQDMLDQEGHNASLQETEMRFREERIAPLQASMQDLQQQFIQAQGAGQDTSLIVTQFEQMQQAMNAAGQELQQTLIEQNEAATRDVYGRMRDTVREVCDELGFAYALATEDAEAPFDPTIGAIGNQVTARLVLAQPVGVDITAEVRERLGISAVRGGDAEERPSDGTEPEGDAPDDQPAGDGAGEGGSRFTRTLSANSSRAVSAARGSAWDRVLGGGSRGREVTVRPVRAQGARRV